MNFVAPTPEELARLRADPLLFEQELDVRPDVAEALEAALGFRAGRRHWRSATGNLYAIDLAELCMWVASVCDSLQVSDMEQVLQLAWASRAEGDSFRLPL
jgi:hypothetical protein